jgi:Fe-S oxidoreductase
LLRTAKKIARRNVSVLASVVSADKPLIGIEPSAILGFRDEYPEIVGNDLKGKAHQLSGNTLLLEEFIVKEFTAGRITSGQFTDTKAEVLLHAHCQQKAVASSACTISALSIPSGYSVKEIPSGCCGMAGSFGYEAEHFDLSNKIGEMILFPAVRNASDNVIIAAPGTSCRHHIKDGTGRIAYHPAEILFSALR